MNYVVIDLETSIKNRGEEAIGRFKANPHHPDNQIVMAGTKADINSNVDTDTNFTAKDATIAPDIELLVGQNIGFDLLYLMRSEKIREWLKTGKIWDTMLVEYILTGQQSKFASLDELSIKYGGTLKNDKIKEYWEAGVDTEDIPTAELREYLIQDVLNTELVFQKQLETAERLGMLPLIFTQMEARVATVEMEWNGMHMDMQQLVAEETLLRAEIDSAMMPIHMDMRKPFPMDAEEEVNPMSPKQLGIYLFGGNYKYTSIVPMMKDGVQVKYKSGAKKGELRTKREMREVHIIGKITFPTDYSEVGSKGAWATGEEVLKKVVAEAGKHPIAGRFCEDILEMRSRQKDLKAYYVGYRNLVWPTDHCIHANFQHCSTDTGRLSCKNPNLQQLTH